MSAMAGVSSWWEFSTLSKAGYNGRRHIIIEATLHKADGLSCQLRVVN